MIISKTFLSFNIQEDLNCFAFFFSFLPFAFHCSWYTRSHAPRHLVFIMFLSFSVERCAWRTVLNVISDSTSKKNYLKSKLSTDKSKRPQMKTKHRICTMSYSQYQAKSGFPKDVRFKDRYLQPPMGRPNPSQLLSKRWLTSPNILLSLSTAEHDLIWHGISL